MKVLKCKKHYIVLFFLIIVACREKELKFVRTIYYDNGQPQFQFLYTNLGDTLNYQRLDFYKSSKPMMKGSYKNGKADGEWIWYYENGRIQDKARLENGFYVDTVFHWFSNGNLKAIQHYYNNVELGDCNTLDGYFVEYDSLGKISCSYINRNGNLDGLRMFRSESYCILLRNYNHGRLIGTNIELHYPKSEFYYVVGQYIDNLENGNWYEYNRYLNKLSKMEYRNGKLDGPCIRYYSNGQVRKISMMKNDSVHGYMKYYDETGKLIKTVISDHGYFVEEY